SKQPPDYLLGKQYCEVFFALYAQLDFARRSFEQGSCTLSDVPWIGFEEPFAEGTDRVIEKWAPGANIPLRINSLLALELTMSQGAGVSVLPCFFGDRNPRLVRVGSYFEGGTYLWVLTHPQLRRTGRVRLFREQVAGWIERDRDLLLGQCPRIAAITARDQ
ncbi:MAG: LysR substrate-binding domain-containing protein, partial [Myxococcota bacterium]